VTFVDIQRFHVSLHYIANVNIEDIYGYKTADVANSSEVLKYLETNGTEDISKAIVNLRP
jgi:hypothetical protein